MKKDKLTQVAIGMGAIAGMRSMAAPAILSEYLNSEKPEGLKDSNLGFIQKTLTSRILEFLAAGEMAGDKSNTAPDRISAGALIGRILSGALVGGSAYAFGKRNVLIGALIGGGAAAVSAYATFFIRKGLDENTNISDKALGFAEDALVVGGSVAINESAK